MLGRSLPLALVVALVLLSYSLVVPVGDDAVEPARFENTFDLGLTDETVREVERRGLSIPRVQVYYSSYEYVVGFDTIESFRLEQQRAGHQRQFGQPVAIFVSDYAGTNASLTENGSLTAANHVGLVDAEDAFVVVGSDARLPSGPVAVPFGERSAAAAFADDYGGDVVPWSGVEDAVTPAQPLTRQNFRAAADNRSAWADAAVATARTLRDRPTSVTVGEDAPSLAAAVDAAPPNTTVRVPPGTYRTDGLTVNKSLTISGAGEATRLRGDGNGTVVHVTAPRVALADLRIDGVGDVGSRRSMLNASRLETAGWSENIELAYGRGDAAVRLVDATESLLTGLHVDTPSSGIVSLNSTRSVVRDTEVNVTNDADDGFMGLVAMHGPLVVEDSQFAGGRDGVYTHRADGVVVRGNTFRDSRFGVHEMYTSRSLVSNNTVRDTKTGVIIMTRPTGTIVVDNDVRASQVGLSTAGSYAYYAGNVVTDNARGIDVLGSQSLVERNTITGNTVGIRSGPALPTNLVTANDIVGNDRAVTADLGPLRVWTVNGSGNYWGPMPGSDADADGYYERSFRPSGAVDGHLHDAPGAWTLARSPAVALTRNVQDTVPGLRPAGVVDTAPRVTPVRPETLAATRGATNATEVTS
ncbi:ABC-type transport system periplasmic substrate-binding protein (probable substrate copper) (plasmid) [Halobacterium hubeiense]|uniref:ABC-type transport system periplasmic substrate-binding protein (Probable substrate copper) n=1 Tax=Halobacterium hubeiense TaxID=1407499 RepID=A0A0U5H832_9EURY|nr:NosD domain-containing protein [Halobacterium hubeiense]CQH63325.1 ABC-type transport system periplasmic substrate-binding protein (probable substrate copper) [Halobacterium hubeiense]